MSESGFQLSTAEIVRENLPASCRTEHLLRATLLLLRAGKSESAHRVFMQIRISECGREDVRRVRVNRRP